MAEHKKTKNDRQRKQIRQLNPIIQMSEEQYEKTGTNRGRRMEKTLRGTIWRQWHKMQKRDKQKKMKIIKNRSAPNARRSRKTRNLLGMVE